MLGTEWVYAAIAGLLFAHLLTLLYAYRSSRSEPAADGVSDAAAVEVADRADRSVCRCPECGTENDRAYRFCRQCVAELPSARLRVEHPREQRQPY
ncbi:DUF7577 domain-containing protein [Halomicrobium katesii]|uniref:DUF7577 domain-containing protein n=1 Tax=Halomicrobium katesii TaxID=437163 RepID=UPI00036AF8D1|nr:hypothetical protein [Halomicrobium katesii]